MLTRRIVLSSLASFGMGVLQAKADLSYAEKVRQERIKAAEDLKGKNSPLALIAGFNVIDSGVSTIGKDPSCSHVLPASDAPDRVGDLTVTQGKAVLQFAPGVRAMEGGKQVNAASIEGNSDQIVKTTVGSLEIRMRWMPSPGKQNLRVSVSDEAFAANKTIQPPVWFPVDRSYRVIGNWVEFPEPKEVRVPDSNGGTRKYVSRGYVNFTLAGHKWTLTPSSLPALETSLFFVFGDPTNGHETYGGGRFLYAEAPKNDKVTLDFNEACNPNCAYNHLWNCPLAPKENRLSIPVRAGELMYPRPVG